jgi:hypothetical protein
MTAHRDSIHIDDLDRPPLPAFTDEDGATVLDEAVTSLVLLRFPTSLEDAAAELHVLASLIAQAQERLPHVVGRALDQDYDWQEIACCLNSTPASARHLFAAGREDPPLGA